MLQCYISIYTSSFSLKGSRDTAQLTRRQVQRSAENTLEEFVHISVCFLERKKGVSNLNRVSVGILVST